MSVQQRSKSAPQLAASFTSQTLEGDTTRDPLYTRKQQSFVHPPINSPSTSRARDEPFALSGFFPSYKSPLRENDGDEGWRWLRDEEEDMESIYTASEEDPTVPPTPVDYCGGENLDRVIQREDKLGVLRLLHFLEERQPTPQPSKQQLGHGLSIDAPSRLLYLEQNVDSFEDMCDTFRARRQARDRGLLINTSEIAKDLSTGPLFSAAREEAEGAEEDWDDILFRGWQRVTNLLF